MKTYLWQEEGDAIDRSISEFTAGEDVILDRQLFVFDIRATAAHVRGLQRIGIVSEDECTTLCGWLERLESEFEAGDFVLDERFEDGHSAIEIYLTEKAGPAGARVHTGRSRNDQVSVATRLYLKDRLAQLAALCGRIAEACLGRAEAEPDLPMPGYTHLQRAVPSSSGLWMAAFAEAFTDDLSLATAMASVIDCSPLGTAAGYGVNLPLDREGVAADLGFARLQVNPMYAQNSRGKFELMALQAAWHSMQDVRRLAWDLSLFTTSEFGFVRLPREYITGSSIMPNKFNPDVVELLRGRAATPEAAITEIQSILSLPSGYQRDLQLTKAPLIRGMESSLQALSIVPALIEGMEFQADRMRSAISPDMFATDIALEQTAAGVPFREAYLEAKRKLDEMDAPDVEASLAQRVSPGGCADLGLKLIRQRLAQAKSRHGDI
ncbi:MAG: argininosuccinate lyase [Gammaproteobacteria bacterium]|nr:argininosuccinate lyase [Gammaproteobacteria bacterium]NNJ78283.1 argininosuccinate lyase [Xanthomonadales bacterium]